MAREVVWTLRAVEDVEAIAGYIARDSPGYAASLVARLLHAARSLADTSERASGSRAGRSLHSGADRVAVPACVPGRGRTRRTVGRHPRAPRLSPGLIIAPPPCWVRRPPPKNSLLVLAIASSNSLRQTLPKPGQLSLRTHDYEAESP